ncbi:MAG: hypothetical protein WA797_05970, partial [Acidimicrobiales bacterium]
MPTVGGVHAAHHGYRIRGTPDHDADHDPDPGTDHHGTDHHGTDHHGTDHHGTDHHGTDHH